MLKRLLVATLPALLLVTTAQAQVRDIPTGGSLVNENVTVSDGAGLSDADAANVIASHQAALNATANALSFLSAFRDDILLGNNQFYNDTFGAFYSRDETINPFVGTLRDPVQEGVIVEETEYVGRINTGGEGNPRVTFAGNIDFMGEFQIGDQVFIGANGDEGGEVYTIVDIELQAVGGNSFNPLETQKIALDGEGEIDERTFEDIVLTNAFLGDVGFTEFDDFRPPSTTGEDADDFDAEFEFPGLRAIVLDRPVNPDLPQNSQIDVVVGETLIVDEDHYDRVVETFTLIQAILEAPTTYYSDLDEAEAQAIFDAILTPGVNTLTDEVLFLDLGPDFIPDETHRRFGFSNSNTPAAQAARAAGTPLLWSQDNEVITDVTGAETELSQQFFNNFLTILSEAELDLANDQIVFNFLVGGAFLSESQQNVSTSATSLFDSTASNLTQQTTLQQFQMIIAAAAAMTGNGTHFGIDQIFRFAGSPNGDLFSPHPQNMDASKFGAFASVDGGAGAFVGDGAGPFEPTDGKQLQAGEGSALTNFAFNPAVPAD